jgi:hypothetical protein
VLSFQQQLDMLILCFFLFSDI